jgi:hypothetical protein
VLGATLFRLHVHFLPSFFFQLVSHTSICWWPGTPNNGCPWKEVFT